MKKFTVPNLIIHMVQVLLSIFLAILPFGAAVLGNIISIFGIDYFEDSTLAATFTFLFFILFMLLSLIFGLVDYLTLSKNHKRAYFVLELILPIIGMAGSITAIVIYSSLVNFAIRFLLRKGFAPIMFMLIVFIILCLLNITFTVLFAVVPRKRIVPLPGAPAPAFGTIPQADAAGTLPVGAAGALPQTGVASLPQSGVSGVLPQPGAAPLPHANRAGLPPITQEAIPSAGAPTGDNGNPPPTAPLS